ncbi:MAG: hypothetical protein ACMVO5_08900 [Polymorphobacter sp.]|uniref:hypothetical protein n=1 Tax=Polymorphobacter sp. TaxID=1909290 RepID=UPI003A86FDBD
MNPLPPISRRFFAGAALGAAGGAMSAGPTRATIVQPRGGQLALSKVVSEYVRFEDEDEAFRQHLRIERDLVEREGTTLTWYNWIAYVIAEGRSPFPLMRYEGIEYSYFRRLRGLEYRIHAHNLSYVRDLETGVFAETVDNPMTGRRVKAMPTLLLNDPGTLGSPKGFRNLRSDGKTFVQPYRQFRIEDELMKLDSVRTAPPDWPVTHIENSCQWVRLADFENPAITSLPTHFAGSYVFPFPEWLGMEGIKGHMLGFYDGRKLNGPQDLPREFLARTEREHPELLQPRWAEFDRPVAWLDG